MNFMTAKGLLNRIMATRPVAEGKTGQKPVLSGPLLVALSIILICAVAWAFFMGFMVGRGQSPQAGINAMTGGLLSPEQQEAERQKNEDKANMSDFLPPVVPVPAPAVAENAAVHQPPSGAATQAWPDAVRPEPKPARPAKPAPKPAAAQDNQRYNYTFQAAAVKSQADANKVKNALAAKKVNAAVRKSGKVYLIMVSLRGTAQDVAALQTKLKAAGLGKPLQVEKTPVRPARNQRKAP